MLRNLGGLEIILLSSVFFMIFGPKKLPELSRGIAEAIREFKKIFRDQEGEETKASTK